MSHKTSKNQESPFQIGDNSMVNLAPILVGDVKEALEQPKLDSSGDINAQWILPTTLKMDPTILPFLWKMMKESRHFMVQKETLRFPEYGCKSMLNEDISQKSLGLFHYPPNEFLPGFTESPADHFYRAYYLQVYKVRYTSELNYVSMNSFKGISYSYRHNRI